MPEPTLPGAIDAWVRTQLDMRIARTGTIIHDPLLGTRFFHPHELTILGTPLLQRLRYISQTGLVYLVYPAARHSRFEHTLGAVALVDRFISALRDRAAEHADGSLLVDDRDRVELRLAALLHDVGHCFFSHASEDTYRYLPEFEAYKTSLGCDKGAGELLSHAIIQTASFQAFFDQVCGGMPVAPRLDVIAGYILGQHPRGGEERQFLADIISGPVDVDKLEYIHRDAYNTGLRLVVDLDRFFALVDVMTCGEDSRRLPRLVLRSPEPLEQIIFSKLMLFATVYHHHKVKACDCALDGAIRWAKANGASGGSLRGLHAPDSWLQHTELDILCDKANPFLVGLRRRDLPYRAFLLSREVVQMPWRGEVDADPAGDPWRLAISDLEQRRDEEDGFRRVADDIYHGLDNDTQAFLADKGGKWSISFVMPKLPSLKELELAFILRGGVPVPASRVIPIEQWLDAYRQNKARAFVFCPREVAARVFDVALEWFRSQYGLQIDAAKVKGLCHLE